MAATGISGLGNGTGYLYVTNTGATKILTNIINDRLGRNKLFQYAYLSQPMPPSAEEYDSTYGYRFYINDDAGALEGDLTGAIEITSYVVPKTVTSALPKQDLTIASGVVTPSRISNLCHADVETEGAVAADNLDEISLTGVIDGDLIIIKGNTTANVVTIRDKSVAGGSANISLADATAWDSGDRTHAIALQYNSADTTWYELFRTPTLELSLTNVRAKGMLLPKSGYTGTAVDINGTTVTLKPGDDDMFQRFTGTGTLVGNWAVAGGGSPQDGDYFICIWNATIDVDAFSVKFFGTALTAAQALAGLSLIIAQYDDSSGKYWVQVLPLSNSTDLVTSTDLATKEDSLGDPATDAYVLSSTAAGVRSWVPNGNDIILSSVVSNSETTAVTTEETLKSYTISGGTLSTNGSEVWVRGVVQTAANANAKTVRLKFGSTTLVTATGNYNNYSLFYEAIVTRVDATNQRATGRIFVADSSGGFVTTFTLYTSPAENLAADVTITLTGQNGVASAADIIARTMVVEKKVN